MMDWWRGLSPREKALIVVAGGLLGALFIVQVVIAPLREARARALASFSSSVATLIEVRDGASFVNAVRAAGGAASRAIVDDRSLRAAVTRTAADRGLSILRIQPTDDGALNVRLENADAGVLYDWLADLAQSRGVRTRRASLRRIDGQDAVTADVVLVAGGGGA